MKWEDFADSKLRPWDFTVAMPDLFRIYRHYLRRIL